MPSTVFNYFFSSFLTAITTFVLAVFVLSRNPKSKLYRTYFLYTISISAGFLPYAFMPIAPTEQAAIFLAHVLHCGITFIPVFFLNFVLILLEEDPAKIRRIMRPLYIIAIFFAVTIPTKFLVSGVSAKFELDYFVDPGPLYSPYLTFWLFSVTYGLLKLFVGYRKARPERRNQLKYIFFSTLVGYVGGASNFSLVFDIKYPFYPFGTYAIAAYAIVVAYAIIPYRLIDIKVYIVRAAVVVSMAGLVIFSSLGMTSLSRHFLVRLWGANWWRAAIIAAVLLAAAGYTFAIRVIRKMDEKRLKKIEDAQEALETSGRGMIEIDNTRRLARIIPRYLTMFYYTKLDVRIEHAAIFLYDADKKKFVLESSTPYKKMFSETEITLSHPLNIWFVEKRRFLIRKGLAKRQDMDVLKYDDINYWLYHDRALKADFTLPFLLKKIREEMDRMKASVLVPSFYKNKLVGFLLLGTKSRGMYTPEELNIFSLLSANAAAAFRGAQLTGKLKETQTELVASERLAAIGRLATSAKHEINNPLQGIYGGFTQALSNMEDATNGFKNTRERLGKISDKIKDLGFGCEADELRKIVFSLEDRSKEDDAFREDLGKKIENIKAISSELEKKNGGNKTDEATYLFSTAAKILDRARDVGAVVRGHLNDGFENAQRISQVIDAIYHLPKEMGKELKAIDVRELVNASFEFVRYQTYWENLTDTVNIMEIPLDLPKIKGYSNRLISVFSNLYINAYQAMTDAGITATKERVVRTMAFISPKNPAFVEIRVANRGPLISEENLEKIFEHGFTTKKKGSGLGLHICKIQVEEFNSGEIYAKNIEGFGPEFVVKLPTWKSGT